jgi:DnaJ-class molecular chaperone
MRCYDVRTRLNPLFFSLPTGGDAEAFVLLQEAYKTLSDPASKRDYDHKMGYLRGHHNHHAPAEQPAPSNGGGGNPCGPGQAYVFMFGTYFCGGGPDLHIVFG